MTALASSAAPPPTCAQRTLARLDVRAQAGQLLVVGAPLAADPATQTARLRQLGVGGVLLTGRSAAGVTAVAARTAALRTALPASAPGLLVAADQEGGQVQTLSGPGFTTIPAASVQGGWAADRLTAAAAQWGAQLRASGVDVDLAPVADVLSARLGAANLAVGVSHRTFGEEPDPVAAGVVAVAGGLHRAGVAATAKHFPGLGQVAPNTDVSANVHDTVTVAASPLLTPFRRAVAAGIPLVMVSSAIYDRIDGTQPAAFSPAVIGLLRGTAGAGLGFGGVVVSDDLGAAAAVAAVPPAERATRFVAAGGDLVLTVDPATAAPMLDGLVARAQRDAAFAGTLRAAAGRVLALKAARGRLTC